MPFKRDAKRRCDHWPASGTMQMVGRTTTTTGACSHKLRLVMYMMLMLAEPSIKHPQIPNSMFHLHHDYMPRCC